MEAIEATVLQPNSIKQRISEQTQFRILPIEGAVPADRYARKHHIIQVVQPDIVNLGPRIQTQHAKPPDWEHVDDIFVEHVDY